MGTSLSYCLHIMICSFSYTTLYSMHMTDSFCCHVLNNTSTLVPDGRELTGKYFDVYAVSIRLMLRVASREIYASTISVVTILSGFLRPVEEMKSCKEV